MKGNKKEINDYLTEEDRKEIYKDIYSSPEYRRLADKFNKCRMSGDFAKSLIYSKKMKEYEMGVFNGIARRYIDRNNLVKSWVDSMSTEDRRKLNILSYSVFMLSDVLEMFITDVNLMTKKYSGKKTFGFDKLNEAVKEAKKVVSHFDTTMSDDKASYLFGNLSDDLYKLIFNKSSSYYNKLNDYAKNVDKKAASDAEVA